MNCNEFLAHLSDRIDGAAAPATVSAGDAHAAACASCREAEASLRALVARLRDLPLERDDDSAHAPELWNALARRMRREGGRPVAGVHAPRAIPFVAWMGLAAAAAIVAVAGLWRGGIGPAAPPAPAPAAPAVLSASASGSPELPEVLDEVDAALRQSRRTLNGVLAARASNLSPETLRVIEENLREMESATRAIEDALARDPGNNRLRQMLVDSHRRQLTVMKDVTLLAARYEKTPGQETVR